MVVLHIHPKNTINFTINEHGDIYNGENYLGELNLYSENDITLTGYIGPTGPSQEGRKGCRGALGPIGETGPVGISVPGPMGYQGENGPMGCMGKIGPRGRCGEQGPQGREGPKGKVRYSIPRCFLYARVDKNFRFSDDRQNNYTILPWHHISNHGFKISNNTIHFPNRFGIYKIECGMQITNFTHDTCNHEPDDLAANSVQLELRFRKQQVCKANTYIIPYCQTKNLTLSNCDTMHTIYTVNEETDMIVSINNGGNVQDVQNTMFLCITEII